MKYAVNATTDMNKVCRRTFEVNKESTAILKMLKFCITKQGLQAMSFRYSINNELTYFD